MKKTVLISTALFAFVLLLSGSFDLKSQSAVTNTFFYSGSVQTYTVPACVSTLTVEVKGAQGGANAMSATQGGLGGMAYGVLTVTPGDVLYIYVGGTNGYNGGGNPGLSSCANAMGGVGGGASDIRLNGTALNNRVVVAGGGGGAGGNRVMGCGRGTGGGGGGGYYGGGGGCGFAQNSNILPNGGNQVCGGSFGVSGYSALQNGSAGIIAMGGSGGIESTSNQNGSHNAAQGGGGAALQDAAARLFQTFIPAKAAQAAQAS